MSIADDNYAKLKENMARMTKWAKSISEREDTIARPRSTIKLQVASSEQSITRQKLGHPAFDILSHGGVPRGRYSILFGGPGQGKSVQAACLMKEAQSEGIVPLYFAAEGTDRNWLAAQGVDMDFLMLNDTEQDCARILNATDEACRGTKEIGKIDVGNPTTKLIIIDSVAAMKHTEEEKKGVAGDNMAWTARRLSQYFRTCTSSVAINGVSVFFINQIRSDMDPNAFEKYPGGNALMHYSALDLLVRRCGKNDFVESIYKYFFEEEGSRTGFPNLMQVRKTKIFGLPENTKAIGILQENIGLVKELTLAQFFVAEDLCERAGATVSTTQWDGTSEKEFKTTGGFGSFVDWIYENYDLAYASAEHAYEKKFAKMLEGRMAKFHRESNLQDLPEPATEDAPGIEAKAEAPEKEPKKRGRKKGKR